jgi:hypothetical protein
MYLLFRYHSIYPADYYGRGYGEKKIIREFIHKEIDERNEEAERLNNA